MLWKALRRNDDRRGVLITNRKNINPIQIDNCKAGIVLVFLDFQGSISVDYKTVRESVTTV